MTTPQNIAADPDLSAWVSASAGTGKTYVLTRRVLRLLLEGSAPQRILCLTFTKAAAAEMANRLNQRLSSWVNMDDGELAAELKDLTGAPPDPARLAEARRLFPKVLDAPGGLRIQTFHSFCESLLARFPLEAGIAPNAQVLDEKAAAELRLDASRRLLARAQHEGEQIAQALDRLAGAITDRQFDELMANLLRDRPKIGALSRHLHDRTGIETALRARLGLSPDDTDENLVAAACRDEAFDRPALEIAVAKLAEGPATAKRAATAIDDWLGAPPPARAEMWDNYLQGLLTAKGEPRSFRIKVVTDDPALAATLQAEQQRLVEVETARKAVEVADLSTALALVAIELVQLYDGLKSLHNRHDFDDLIHRARRLLNPGIQGPMAAAWVLYKLDEGLEHILVDEAQDSNAAQWDIIDPLAREFFAGEGTSNRPRTIFAVGDPKQSIFSFQGAQPREFEDRQLEFSRLITAAEQQFERPVLDMSFRSSPAVLHLVDEVFRDEAARSGLVFTSERERAQIHHEANRARTPGRVVLWEPELKQDIEEPGDWDPPVIPKPWADPRTLLAQRIARQIRSWLDHETPLSSCGRPIRPGDILVLVRRRNEFVTSLVKSLKQHSIDVAGVDRLVLGEQLVVQDLLSLAAFTLQPDDDLRLAEVLRSPLIGLGEDRLENIAVDRGRRSLWRALQLAAGKDPAAEGALRILLDCLRRADRVSPYDFFSRVLDGMEGRKRLLARLGREAGDAIDEFLNQALDFERRNAPSLQGFVHWVSAAETEVKREQEDHRDEVRVMTVHGAKGLQAPIIILADTLSKPDAGASANIFWLEDETTGVQLPFWAPTREFAVGDLLNAYERRARENLEEYHRLLYVALTRAEDELYITGFGSRVDAGSWYETVEAGFARLEGARETSDIDGRPAQVYEFGDQPEEPGEKSRGPDEQHALPDWVHRPAPREPEPPTPLAPSRPSGPEPTVRSPIAQDEPGDRFLRGNLIHALLQYLPEQAPEEWEDRARAYLSQPGFGLDPEQVEDWTGEVLGILRGGEFAPLFGPGSRAEVPLSGLIGTTPISGQVDRLAVRDDGILIVDYKTNRPPPERVEDVSALYLRQLAAYRGLLAQIYPGRTIRCALLWTDGPRLMEIPGDVLAPHEAAFNTSA